MHAPQKPNRPGEFDQVLRRVQSIFEEEEQRSVLLRSQGETAQEWLDLFQLLAEYPKITTNLRSSIFKLMIRLSGKSGLHPQCLTIWGVEKLGNDPVGGGAFGDVWQGRIGQQLVCLKVVRAFRRSDIKLILKNYMQEAIIWRQLDHPNVLPFMGIYYLDKEQKRLCLVSPWMERGNLVDFMKASPNLVDHDLLAYDIARGLSYLHAKKIVHGDLKGVNILITPDLRACIGDFGLSRVSATLPLLSETTRPTGTTRWLSPELMQPATSCVPTKHSDVYAFACVCYEIFTGRLPFYELPNDASVLCAVLLHKQHPSRADDCTKLRSVLWEMMVACWDEVPSSRPMMTEVVERLCSMNANRYLRLASEWTNLAFTQIWNDLKRPSVTQTLELIPPQSIVVAPTETSLGNSSPRSDGAERNADGCMNQGQKGVKRKWIDPTSYDHLTAHSSLQAPVSQSQVQRRQPHDGKPTAGMMPTNPTRDQGKKCLGCGVSSTPAWRRGPLGPSTLCNACGLMYKKLLKKRKLREESTMVTSDPTPSLCSTEPHVVSGMASCT